MYSEVWCFGYTGLQGIHTGIYFRHSLTKTHSNGMLLIMAAMLLYHLVNGRSYQYNGWGI